MYKLDLNGSWKMRKVGDIEYINAKVPGSVTADLINAGLLEDPFYRDNELKARDLALDDYEYSREFLVGTDILNCDKVILCCEGLDTLANITVNGAFVAAVDNMHRTYEFDIKSLLFEGVNSINITFSSPIKYIREKEKLAPLAPGEITNSPMPGMIHIRKASYMFGWDWGPQIPDAGIWRGISIKGYESCKLKDVYISQHHNPADVNLDIRVHKEIWSGREVETEVIATSPDGERISATTTDCKEDSLIRLQIKNPKLWWPNGYGKQDLYNVEVTVKEYGKTLDCKNYKIGLRTMGIRREKDQWGESFEFVVNGISIFAMGADYIPEDNILSRCTSERTEKLIKDCAEANFNFLRVWGGGIYPEDYFFDLCDQYGIIIWQDFMFACSAYILTDEFLENVRQEAVDNIRRLRHHACLGLWCGNNEIEWGIVEWDYPKPPRCKPDYLKLFEIVIPQVLAENDPNTFYWPSSPSSGGCFDKPNDENIGDVHNWDVWHSLKPFSDYRKSYYRFISEFGFQSFPCLKTVETFTLPEDRNIFSYVMECHQKNSGANGKILYYLAQNFKYPKDFDSMLYCSQLLQAEAVRYGVEHWRRHRGRCMGAAYWQLNDCWPVASWASIDSDGRWKALHYFAKRFYSPVMLSACEEDTKVSLHITNDTLAEVSGNVVWRLRDNKGLVIKSGNMEARVNPTSAKQIIDLDFAKEIGTKEQRMSLYLEYLLERGNAVVSSGTVLFVQVKHFMFLNPEIQAVLSEEDNNFIVELHSKAYAKYVEVMFTETDIVLEDNYFDMSPGMCRKIRINKSNVSGIRSREDLEKQLRVRSIFDIV